MPHKKKKGHGVGRAPWKYLVRERLAVAEIYVHVGSQAGVVREVPADVVGVFVEHDLIGCPNSSRRRSSIVGRGRR